MTHVQLSIADKFLDTDFNIFEEECEQSLRLGFK